MIDVTTFNDHLHDYKMERPPSEQLVELHIYVVPKERWLEKRKLAKNQAVDHTISVGFVRVLPHTQLSDLRKEMYRQLGLDNVPQNFIFLRSVGRNFTQLKPRQEMEMKVKNFMPPYATDPEIYLKEGPYTGPNIWSQGEDSGLEESVGDSNSQRSHDRATPESLTDEQLVLPKVHLLESGCDLDDLPPSATPPSEEGEMAIPVAPDENDLITAAEEPQLVSSPPEKLDSRPAEGERATRRSKTRREQSESVDLNDLPKEATNSKPGSVNNNNGGIKRGNSLTRRPSRVASKERGGTQLPTWAETRTTRLRRNKALGESIAKSNANQNQNPINAARRRSRSIKRKEEPEPPTVVTNGDKANGEDSEDEEEVTGGILMERIRANSRCLRARLSSHSRRHVADTGSASAGDHNSKYKGNGVYTMHARRHLRVPTNHPETRERISMEVQNTSIRLLDSHGKDVELENPITIKKGSFDDFSEDQPEILHYHTLTGNHNAVSNEEHYEEFPDRDNLAGNSPEQSEPAATQSEDDQRISSREIEDGSPTEDAAGVVRQQTLDEGQMSSREGNLTIEVQVQELEQDGEDVQYSQDNAQNLLQIDGDVHYDSYPVFSEQNAQYPAAIEFTIPAGSSMATNRKHARGRAADSSRTRNANRKQDRPQYSRGIHLRKMEHREQSASALKRTQSDGDGLDVVDTELGDTLGTSRRGGMGSIEKWNTTASTGDLRELPWDHISEKERLLTILESVRLESRAREKQREELLRRVKQLQNRVHLREEEGEENSNSNTNPDDQNRCLRSLPQFARRADSAAVREMWRKRFLETKKSTPRMEEECSKLRQELEKLHRELLAKVQAGVWALLTISGKTEKPSNKLSYKIMIARLLQEVEDLSRRVEGTRLKLHTEVKLRAMAEKDVRNLREELLKKKIQVTLTRNQEQAALGNGIRQQYFISAV